MAEFDDGLRRLVAACATGRERKLALSSADAFPAYVDAVARQEAAERALRASGDVVSREAAETADRRRRLAHDTAHYVCGRLNRMCDRHGLPHVCPDVPSPDEADGRDPAVRDAVAGFAARVTLDRAFGDGRHADAHGRALLSCAVADAADMPGHAYGRLFAPAGD